MDLELVFTLKVPAWDEGAAHINLKDEEIELIRKETEDPEAQDILYTFEETVTGGETYDFILTADWEIPFTLKVERKKKQQEMMPLRQIEPAKTFMGKRHRKLKLTNLIRKQRKRWLEKKKTSRTKRCREPMPKEILFRKPQRIRNRRRSSGANR